MQPIEYDEYGVIRFKENKIVRFLLDNGPHDMNSLALQGFSAEDQAQFAQLIGYSISGFGDLSYADVSMVEHADEIAALLRKDKG